MGESRYRRRFVSAAAPAGPDGLYVTGTWGCRGRPAAAGSRRGVPGTNQLRRRFLYPTPRLREGLQLRSIASAMIDVSDGLHDDAGKLLCASGCGARLDAGAIPVSAPLLRYAGPERARELALSGGDDYELLFTVPARRSRAQNGHPPLGLGHHAARYRDRTWVPSALVRQWAPCPFFKDRSTFHVIRSRVRQDEAHGDARDAGWPQCRALDSIRIGAGLSPSRRALGVRCCRMYLVRGSPPAARSQVQPVLATAFALVGCLEAIKGPRAASAVLIPPRDVSRGRRQWAADCLPRNPTGWARNPDAPGSWTYGACDSRGGP